MAIKRPSRSAKSGYTWMADVYYTDPYGVRKRYRKSGFRTRALAEQHEKEMSVKLSQEEKPIERDLSLDAVFREVMKMKTKLAPSTIRSYQAQYELHLHPVFGKTKVTEINYADLQAFFNDLDVGLNNQKFVKVIMSMILNYSVRAGYIESNPCHYVTLPKPGRKVKKDTITEDEFCLILDSIDTLHTNKFRKDVLKTAMQIGYHTGLRIGETCGLRWEDIDLENRRMRIGRKVELYDGDPYVSERLKTEASYAEIPFGTELQQYLKWWRMENPFEQVICNRKGEVVRQVHVNDSLRRAAEKAGVEFHSHMLRHTYGTNLVRDGVEAKQASMLMRHAHISMTLETYTSLTTDDLESSLKKAGRLGHKSDTN